MTISTLNKIIIMILLKKIIILTVELTIKKTIISTLSLRDSDDGFYSVDGNEEDNFSKKVVKKILIIKI